MMKTYDLFYVDDDPDDLEFFSDAIYNLQLGCGILHTFRDGFSLLKALRSHTHNNSIIFSDINMPLITGLELLAHIRRDPDISALPVVMLTTSSLPDNIETSRRLGADLYAIKPGTISELAEIVRKVLTINWSEPRPISENYVLNKKKHF